MKILVYGINFAPELTGIGKYTGEMADWLSMQGHEVRVVTAPPYYPAWKVGAGYSGRAYARESMAPIRTENSELRAGQFSFENQGPGADKGGALGVSPESSLRSPSYLVYRCPLWVPGKASGAKRLVHLASFALTSLPVMLRQVFWRPDVVWMAAPALMCAPGAWLTARLSGAKAVIHIQDYEVDAAFQLGLLKSKLARRFALWCERRLLHRFDVVSTISGRMVDLAKAKAVTAEKVVFFPNWVDLGSIVPKGLRTAIGGGGQSSGDSGLSENSTPLQPSPSQGRVQSYREELGIPADAVVVLYSGNMGMKQGLEVLPEVAALCAARGLSAATGGGVLIVEDSGLSKNGAADGVEVYAVLSPEPSVLGEPSCSQASDIYFVFCGQGAGKAALDAQCEGLANVRFLPLQPMERFGELLTTADIHILPQRADAADLVMPSKLTGMLASARPVVATAQPGTELADVVVSCGLVVPPEDAAAIAQAVLRLAGDAAQRAKLGAAGRAYAESNLDREFVLRRFEQTLVALRVKYRGPLSQDSNAVRLGCTFNFTRNWTALPRSCLCVACRSSLYVCGKGIPCGVKI